MKVNEAYLIHASPTSGKSTWFRALRKEGYAVIETDDIIKLLLPEFYDLKPWRKAHNDRASSLLLKAMNTFVGIVVTQLYQLRLVDVVLTNLIGDAFTSQLDPKLLLDGKFRVSFFVEPREMVARSVKRGGTPFPLDLTQRWFRDWERFVSERAAHSLVLEEGMYLSDVLTVTREPEATSVVPDGLSPALTKIANFVATGGNGA